MDVEAKQGTSAAVPPRGSGLAAAGWGILAIAALLALVDVAIETWWSGSALRWWIALPAFALVVASVWLWWPTAEAVKRWGWAGAASWSVGCLFLVLAASAWLPGGLTDGVRMMLQPTPTALTVVTAAAVVLAAFVLFRALEALPSTPRLAARGVVAALALYALASLGLALYERTPFTTLFQGGAAWHRLPRWLQGTFIGALGLLPLALLGQIVRLVGLRTRMPRVGPLLGQAAVLAMALVVTLAGVVAKPAGTTGPAVQAGSPGSGIASRTFEVTSDEFVLAIKAYQALPAQADRSGFDVKAKAVSLKDVAAAFTFVRDEIANDLYPGVLRGATGTLSAAAGNDADKALLLADLLREQGRPVRFARCELTEVKANERVHSVFERPKPKPPADPAAAVVAALVRQGIPRDRAAAFVDAGRVRERAIDAASVAGANADLTTVREALRAANVVPTPRFNPAALAAEARAHVWVQWEGDGRWQDLDPAFPGAQQGAAVCEPAQTMESLPPALYQKLTITVRNDYLSDGRLHATTVLTRSFQASDLHARSMYFLNVPIPLDAVGAGGLSAAQGFIPVLIVNDGGIKGDAFPLVQTPPQRQPAGAGSLFGSLGGGETAPSGEGGGALAAQWLDFTIEAPGRKAVVSRAVFDAIRPDERAAGPVTTAPDTTEFRPKLCTTYAIAVSTGRIDPVQFMEAAYAGFDADAIGLLAAGVAASTASGMASGTPASDVLTAFVDQQSVLLGARALRFAAELDRAQSGAWRESYRNAVAFRDQPLIVIANLAVGAADAEGGLSFDLRHDEMRVMSKDSQHAEEAFWLNVHRGLVDGAVERAALPTTAVPAGTSSPATERNIVVASMSTVSELARASGIPFRAAVGTDAAGALRAFGTPGGVRLAQEVHENTAAVLPDKPVRLGDANRLGMWALNLETGHVIPLLDTGLRHAVSMAVAPRGAFDGQGGVEYDNTRRTREIDIWWRTANRELDKVERLLHQYKCFATGAHLRPECQMLQKAGGHLIRTTQELARMYRALGEAAPFVP